MPDTKAFSPKDIVIAGTLFLLGCTSVVVPKRFWPGLCRRMAGIACWLRFARSKEKATRVSRIAGHRANRFTPEDVVKNHTALRTEEYLHLLRRHVVPDPQVKTRIVGCEHLEAALAEGKGVVLWLGYFVFGSQFDTLALSRAGHQAIRVATVAHGYSSTDFGLRYLNRIKTRVEDRCVAERILIDEPNRLALIRIRQKLKENKIIAVRGHYRGRTALQIPFMDGMLRLATGPVELAMLTKAKLLPAYTVRTQDGVFELRVQAPLIVPETDDREQVYQDVALRYAQLTEDWVSEYPAQWMCWFEQAEPLTAETVGASIRRIPGKK